MELPECYVELVGFGRKIFCLVRRKWMESIGLLCHIALAH
jgi:hypothetical protein